ncbi:hypothetical protein EST38_g3583 [Candolleomyces aberdarensis]|uniref:NAD(P)-binding domain-containing protein n=1 Tax=Candolleomyces aberdarensis TaxID=2316362 RepID=A0A4Q2DRY0_9AGAR|nr:hypothetical protein EST38_g3583 [Candolleomyces aberdarensis]
MAKNVVIIGGHGKIALKLATLLSQASNKVYSVIRDESQSQDIQSTGATPVVLSLENDPAEKFTEKFIETQADVVYFAAGAGGKGGEERTKKVDFEGAVKTFDAIEAVTLEGGKKNPRLILVSAIDVRDPEKIPDHYNEDDKLHSERVRKAIGAYMHWKYEADKNLVKRSDFDWTILRPGGLTDTPGTGNAHVGQARLGRTISRDDVALALSLLVDREDAAGLAIDLGGGETPIKEGLDLVIRRRATDWLG